MKTTPTLDSKQSLNLNSYKLELEKKLTLIMVLYIFLPQHLRHNDSRPTSTFYTYLHCKSKICNLVFNKEREFDIVFSTLVKNSNLRLEALTYPYEILWVNNTSLMVTHSCVVPLNFGKYKFLWDAMFYLWLLSIFSWVMDELP